jgi:RNA polymerase sigma factor (sigma-70 family)
VDQTATGPDRIAVELAADLDTGFAALFEAHQNVLFSTALRICGRWADAEDLTAAAFLRAFRALSGYDRERIAGLRTRPWLLTILLNAWRNQVRTAARRPREVLDTEPPELEARGASASAEVQAERHETSRELAALLDLLPDRQRVAVVLRYVADLPIAEVASVLGCPPGTAKSHVSRGLRRLRELQAARVLKDARVCREDRALTTERENLR